MNMNKSLKCMRPTTLPLILVLILHRNFGSGIDLVVRFFHREEDKRARILCRSPKSSGSAKYCCLPLNTLHIRRPESSSSLQLCRRTGSGPELWANLKFTTIERRLYISMLTCSCTDSHRYGIVLLHVPRTAISGLWQDGTGYQRQRVDW